MNLKSSTAAGDRQRRVLRLIIFFRFLLLKSNIRDFVDANTTLVQLCILSSMYCDIFVVFIKNCTKLVRYLDIIWPCILIIMIIKLLFSGILFICARVVSFASLAALGLQMTLLGRK